MICVAVIEILEMNCVAVIEILWTVVEMRSVNGQSVLSIWIRNDSEEDSIF